MKDGRVLTRKRSRYGLTVWRLPERPSRSGVHFEARPHYALAPKHWTAEQVWQGGLVFLTYEDALIGLGRVASLLKAAPQAIGDYVRMQHGYALRAAADWQEPAPAAAAKEGGQIRQRQE